MFVPHNICQINQVLDTSWWIVHKLVIVIHSGVLDKIGLKFSDNPVLDILGVLVTVYSLIFIWKRSAYTCVYWSTSICQLFQT